MRQLITEWDVYPIIERERERLDTFILGKNNEGTKHKINLGG